LLTLAAARRLWPSRVWQRALVVVTALVVLFAAATARLFVWPAQGMPPRVSAIVLFAGPGERLPVALRLAREHRAPILVVSRGQHGYSWPCPPAVPGVTLICFDPDPGDTRGEAEFAGQLAKRYHWSSVVVVTGTEQDTRARMLMKRCFAGSVYVVTGPLPMSIWPYQIAYEWAALFKALVIQRGC